MLISLQRSSPNETMELSAPAAGDSVRRMDAVATRSVVLLAGPGATRQRRDQHPSRDEESPSELTSADVCRAAPASRSRFPLKSRWIQPQRVLLLVQ